MRNLKVLLVDADTERLETVSSMLEEAAHTVLPAASLEEADEALFVLKIDVAVFGSVFDQSETEIFVERLRGIENTQKNALRAPVFTTSADVPVPPGWVRRNGGVFDGNLSESFDSEILLMAVQGIGEAEPTAGADAPNTTSIAVPLFEPELFRQQVAYDPNLTVEIIDLFMDERQVEMPEMAEALSNGDFERLSRVAHTMKGSLGTLHAALVRQHAQELESAAKNRNGEVCRRTLELLAADLDALEPLLWKLRNEVKP